MNDIKRLVGQFRDAIDRAKKKGEFETYDGFVNFPRGSCGDTSLLLAQFLLENDIRTDYVCGTSNNQSHAWLLTDNHNTIIDITGDQFEGDPDFLNYDKSVYVGAEDDFHRLFKGRKIRKNIGLDDFDSECQSMLKELYSRIIKYIFID